MSIPKEPRQIMINLMYLVLTAMLALNISNEILHAFKILNNGITKSNEAVESKNQDIMQNFDANMQQPDQRDSVRPYNEKAKEIRKRAADMFAYLEDWKKKVIMQAGGYKTGREAGEIKNEENIDASTYLLVEQKGGNDIKKRLNEFRTFLLSQINQDRFKDQYVSLEKDLPIQTADFKKDEDNPTGDWTTGTFYHVPTLGVIALMSKMQNDVRNSEAAVLNELFREAKAKPLVFDAITSIAVPKTSYALVGQPIEANIMVAAYNHSVTPIISASSGQVTEVKDGIGTWKTTASGLGLQTVHGQISVVNNGQRISKDWSFQYMVGTAGASMQLDKMNVFYIGVPNPITVTAAGYSLEDVSVSIPGASVTAGAKKGTYNVTVPMEMNGKRLTATISAKTNTGMQSVGTMEVRVKRIPDPSARIANKMGGGMPANVFRAQQGVAAVLEGFDFECPFRVESFEFSYQQRRSDYQGPFNVSGAYFNKEAQVFKYVQSMAKPGDRVYIDNIRVRGCDGQLRGVNNISLTLQ
jgi:gliding motility-associated protein GldM